MATPFASSTTPSSRKASRLTEAEVRASLAEIIAAEAPSDPDDLDWLAALSILTAAEDEFKVQFFPDFTGPTVRAVLRDAETVADLMEYVVGQVAATDDDAASENDAASDDNASDSGATATKSAQDATSDATDDDPFAALRAAFAT